MAVFIFIISQQYKNAKNYYFLYITVAVPGRVQRNCAFDYIPA